MNEPIVQVRDLQLIRNAKSGQLLVLDGVTFDVREGEFVAIVGPSGCGKTTLLKVIDGLLPRTAGSINVAGHDVDRPQEDRAFVFQHDSASLDLSTSMATSARRAPLVSWIGRPATTTFSQCGVRGTCRSVCAPASASAHRSTIPPCSRSM